RLAIRADANARIGAGHVMRCMALADAWRRAAGETILFTVDPPPLVAAAADRRGVSIRSRPAPEAAWDALLDWARANAGAWVALDSYDAGIDAHRSLRAAGVRLLVIDDAVAHPELDCDILLNPNIGAEALVYHAGAATHRCLGPRYALIRDEFRRQPPPRRFDAVASRLIVTFGGADVHDQASRAARILAHAAPPADATVGAGQAHGGMGAGIAAAEGVHIRWRGATDDIASLLASADLAICAAGSTCWELAHLGVPALTLIVADNQVNVAAGLQEAGAARSAGWFDAVSDDALASAIEALRRDGPAREAMSRRGRALVDGLGADRVV